MVYVVPPPLAREPRVANGVFRSVAARGVGEQEVLLGIEVVQDPGFPGPIQVHAPDRHGDDFGARRLDRPDHRPVVTVVARSQHETPGEGASADGERPITKPPNGRRHPQHTTTTCTRPNPATQTT